MLNDITRNRFLAFWFAAVALVLASAMAMGVNVGVSTTAFVLMLALVPPGIFVALWRATPPQTIGDILYAANKGSEDR
jgi:hypothetical protein